MRSGPLTFELDGRTLLFATLDDFAFGLSGRVQIATDSVTYPLTAGVNVIGSHPEKDVVVGGWYRDAPRKHLMVNAGGDDLSLTGLSTHGTFLPGRLLGNVGE